MALFDTIRRKPEAVRSRYAFFLSGLVTGIIFIFWFLVWRELEVPVSYRVSATSTEVGPVEGLTRMFSGGFERFKEQFGGKDSEWASFTQNIEGFNATSVGSSTASSTDSLTDSYSTTTQAQ